MHCMYGKQTTRLCIVYIIYINCKLQGFSYRLLHKCMNEFTWNMGIWKYDSLQWTKKKTSSIMTYGKRLAGNVWTPLLSNGKSHTCTTAEMGIEIVLEWEKKWGNFSLSLAGTGSHFKSPCASNASVSTSNIFIPETPAKNTLAVFSAWDAVLCVYVYVRRSLCKGFCYSIRMGLCKICNNIRMGTVSAPATKATILRASYINNSVLNAWYEKQ